MRDADLLHAAEATLDGSETWSVKASRPPPVPLLPHNGPRQNARENDRKGLASRSVRSVRFQCERQSDRYASTGTRTLALRLNRSAVQLHQAPHDGQTEAETFPRR